MTGWFLSCHFVGSARPATTTTMEGKITFGYPNRTTAVTAFEVIKAQNSASGRSASTNGLFCPCYDFCLIELGIDGHKPEPLSLPFPWLPGWRVMSPTACGIGLVGWYDLTPPPHWKVEMFSTCTVVCMVFLERAGKKWRHTAGGLQKVFGLKSRPSMSVSFDRQHFKLVLVSCKHSASFSLSQKKEASFAPWRRKSHCRLAHNTCSERG